MGFRPSTAAAAVQARSQASGLLLVGWGLVGAYLVCSAIDLAVSGWRPVVDNAVIAAMAIDSISLDPPLVGAPTSAGLEGGDTLSHAGPLGLWLLAVPAKVLGEPGYGLLVGGA